LFANEGYTCGLSGKLHLSACHPTVNKGTERRIDDGYSMFHWSHHPQDDWPTNEYSQWLRSRGKKYTRRPVEGTRHVVLGPDAEDHQATWCAEKAIDFIEAHEGKDQPWLFSVNIFAPHHPFDPPESHLRRYLDRLEDIPLPNYEEGELAEKTSYQRRDHQGAYASKNLYPFDRMSEREHRLVRAAYWAMVDLIDEQVGRMLEALDRTGQKDDTLVIFMSDHGELLGDHGVYLKGPHFYEVSVHVPLIIRFPGRVEAGKKVESLIELVDLAPTLLEAAELPIYAGMQGKSLWPVLRGETDAHRDDVFCEAYESKTGGSGYSVMVRDERYKLVMYATPGDGELYDLSADPRERHNLWQRPEAAAVQLRMTDRLCRRLAAKFDPLPLRIAPW
jgi:arylsulfatase A-like enzyme